ncbi:class I SAM-dependent methyltransferase [Basilea psittacipulmonis]|uniref:Methyltransferase type 11 domain-containing protein n=1 Tax=Basilea psittacipulmonis DSM 24701 TaxID=1072685 RepID=A0A077DHL8_9BURK|nr:methyltransferase domain-containing protein [Basilea psittacipulmonis]AIL33057.1 hypothetical protein IX83_06810 [Basilea psittacipulmonis DSM 24701]
MMKQWANSHFGQYILSIEQKKILEFISNKHHIKAIQFGMNGLNFLENDLIDTTVIVSEETDACSKNRLFMPSFTHLPLEDNSVDLVLLPHTLNFYPQAQKILHEAIRILKKQGTLILTAFNPDSLALSKRFYRHHPIESFIHIRDLYHTSYSSGISWQFGDFLSYIPYTQNPYWIKKLNFLEKAGNRWWPTQSNIFILCGKKE